MPENSVMYSDNGPDVGGKLGGGLDEKIKKLIEILQDLKGGAVLAFSGGLDSGFLSFIGKRHVPSRLLCITVRDPTLPSRDLRDAIWMADKWGLEHRIIDRPLPQEVAENTSIRCYHCKHSLFSILGDVGKKEGLPWILDGSTASDLGDHRPGMKAAVEHQVRSPLLEAELTKREIRTAARDMGIPLWNKPSSACLSSRFPYGTSFTPDMLKMVDDTEEHLRAKGFIMVRVRWENGGARIELGEEEINAHALRVLVQERAWMEKRGWSWAALDLRGYRPAGTSWLEENKRTGGKT